MGPVTARLSPAPATLFSPDGSLRDGVYAGGVTDPDLGLHGPFAYLRQKEWHYLSVCTQSHFVAVAVVQLGYLANAFAYAVDLAAPGSEPWIFEALSPLGRAATFAPAADRGQTRWLGRDARIAIAGDRHGWRVDLDVLLGRSGDKRTLRGQFTIQRAEALALVHRLPTGNRPTPRRRLGFWPTSICAWATTG